MGRYSKQKSFQHKQIPATGILLTNLGTPSEPTSSEVRRYLAEFLSDCRVIEIPQLFWKPILYGLVLTRRPKIAAHAYQKIWMEQGSPLLVYSQAQQQAIQKTLESRIAGPVKVALAMRYGSPSLQDGLNELREANVKRLLVLPLYPQYSATTTASTFDAIANIFKSWRWIPEFRMVNTYFDYAPYIDAIVQSIQSYWQQHSPAEKLLLSFHGLPQRNLTEGDPYFCQCHKTARLVTEKLGLNESEWVLTFQSRFGRQKWLTPATDQTLKSLAKSGVKNVHVICPGFPADCLETLEEIEIQNKQTFLQAGGNEFHYIPALNNNVQHIDALCDLICLHAQGWPEFSDERDVEQQQKLALQSEKFATLLGAED